MSLYSAQLELCATVWIHAPSKSKGLKKLEKLYGLNIDVLDGMWFSECQIGGPNLPEVSFSPTMTAKGHLENASFERVTKNAMRGRMAKCDGATINEIFPGIGDFENRGSRVYSEEVRLRVDSFIRADSLDQAKQVFRPDAWCVDVFDSRDWFLEDQIDGYPAILAPMMTIVSVYRQKPKRDILDFEVQVAKD